MKKIVSRNEHNKNLGSCLGHFKKKLVGEWYLKVIATSVVTFSALYIFLQNTS